LEQVGQTIAFRGLSCPFNNGDGQVPAGRQTTKNDRLSHL